MKKVWLATLILPDLFREPQVIKLSKNVSIFREMETFGKITEYNCRTIIYCNSPEGSQGVEEIVQFKQVSIDVVKYPLFSVYYPNK